VRWFRKKTRQGRSTHGGRKAFRYVLELGDTESDRVVSSAVMDRLVQATKGPALHALDRHWRTEMWCSEIRTHTSLQGPCVYFILDINVQPGETQDTMAQRVNDEFSKYWDAAVRTVL